MSDLRPNELSSAMSSSKGGDGQSALLPIDSQCKLCRSITLEQLVSPLGCLHAPNRKALVRSGQTCKFCSMIFRKDRLGRGAVARDMGIRLRLAKEKSEEVLFLVEHVGGDDPNEPRGRTIRLKVFTEDNDPALTAGVTLKRAMSNTSSDESFAFVNDQLSNCLRLHDCGTSLPLISSVANASVRPTRLIDCQAFGSSDDVRLVSDVDIADKYIALSYCWGRTRAFITTSKSLRLRQSRIAHDTLPKTFRDVVQIARRLKVRYIWIDALCIIQDDITDWTREAAKMGVIYSQAYVTVAADASSDPSGGCFNASSTSQDLLLDQPPFRLQVEAQDDKTSSIYLWDPSQGTFATFRTSHPEIDSSPLSDRGWICQERILSPRILHFTQSQLFWECRCTFASEDGLQTETQASSSSTLTTNRTGPSLARNLYDRKRSSLAPPDASIGRTDAASIKSLISIWYNSVIAATYSRRDLTKADDKLPAISGIARAFDHHLRRANLKYFAGMWAGNPDGHDGDVDTNDVLSQGLGWRRRGPTVRPVQYRAPSFSWASLDTQIEWPAQLGSLIPAGASQTQFVDKLRSAIEVIEVHLVFPEEGDEFGRIEKGSFLELYAHVTKLTIVVRKRIGAIPVPTAASLRQSFSSTSAVSASSDADVLSHSTPTLTQSSTASSSYVFTWEVLSSHRKWIGTAAMDDDLTRATEHRTGEHAPLDQFGSELEDGTVKVVDAMLLEREDQGGRSRYLLLEGFDSSYQKSRADVSLASEDAPDDPGIRSFRRIGVAEIHGLDDTTGTLSRPQAVNESQACNNDEEQGSTRLRLY